MSGMMITEPDGGCNGLGIMVEDQDAHINMGEDIMRDEYLSSDLSAPRPQRKP